MICAWFHQKYVDYSELIDLFGSSTMAWKLLSWMKFSTKWRFAFNTASAATNCQIFTHELHDEENK